MQGKYTAPMDLITTQKAIKFTKDTFERNLAHALELTRVSAPLFVLRDSGLNDNLNGYERAVSFDILRAFACKVEEVRVAPIRFSRA